MTLAKKRFGRSHHPGDRHDWNAFGAATQKFLFAHECGHVNTGDAGPMKEVSANCWGAQFAQKQYHMQPSDWSEVRNVLVAYFPTPAPPYPSGVDQWIGIQQCLAAGGS
jgi:hypothetical protein